MKKVLCGLALVSSVALIPACSSDDDNGTTSSSGGTGTVAANVDVKNNVFEPATVTIKVGQTVRWNWVSGQHDVVSGTNCTDNGKFKSELQTSGSFEKKFDEAGTFDYYCTPHCQMNMVGKVVVTP